MPSVALSENKSRNPSSSNEFQYNPIGTSDEVVVAVGGGGNTGVLTEVIRTATTPLQTPSTAASPALYIDDNNDSFTSNLKIEDRYTHKEIIKIAAIVSPIWFGANCLYNYSLLKTSVGSSTIIRY
jgi:hypothetical protein